MTLKKLNVFLSLQENLISKHVRLVLFSGVLTFPGYVRDADISRMGLGIDKMYPFNVGFD